MNIDDRYNEAEILLNCLKNQQSNLIDVTEACIFLNIRKSYLYKLVEKKKIPFYRPWGKKIFFSRKELERWIINGSPMAQGEKA